MRNINDLVLDLMESILTKALLFDNNSSDTNTSTSITMWLLHMSYLLKDLTNHFFSGFTECYWNKVIDKNLNKSVSMLLVT